MIFIPRKVHELSDEDSSQQEVKHNEPLISLRSTFAWILLGEPGAGKSCALKNEAEATGGLFLRIAEFIEHDPADPEWQNKTLFLDGLDEVRANGRNSSTLLSVRKQLKNLGNPSFRIACRAADWYGSTDREDLKSAAPNQKIKVLQLAPLDENEILRILHDFYHDNACDFLKKAKRHGIADLLTNPQTLNLLITAVGTNNEWPDTRDDVFKLACDKLAEEPNKRHRDSERAHPINKERILAAAGQLFALLLFSGKIGLALDSASTNEHFFELEDYISPDTEAASAAVRKKLFCPEESEERLVPYHRSIAEYLAARWLADQIDHKKIPLKRILNLLFSSNDRVVAGLRGLYGWLALHSKTARTQLIDIDPITVIIYGDVEPMSTMNKQHLLKKLHEEAKDFTHFFWKIGIEHPFGALADPALQERYSTILRSTERSNASQAYVDCVLTILSQKNTLDLQTELFDIIQDDSRWPTIRCNALEIWLKKSTPKSALHLLNNVNDDEITDRDDELTGILLNQLYPEHIEPANLFKYFHPPKNPNLIATYAFFWIKTLSSKAPENHLPMLMDQIVKYSQILYNDTITQHRFIEMAIALLLRSLKTHGDSITDDRIYTWLGIGINHERQNQQEIKHWLEARPEKYKALLNLCFRHCEKQDNVGYCIYISKQRLRNASPPQDIGLWHLNQLTSDTTDNLAKLHLSASVMAFYDQIGAEGLSIEYLRNKGNTAHPKGKEWLDELFKCDLPDWQKQMTTNNVERNNRRIKEKENHTSRLEKYLPSIPNGTAPAGIMYELSGVWEKRFLEVHGETITDRFNNFYNLGSEVLTTAEKGFQQTPFRADLPTVKEIIALKINHQEHLLQISCLIGMGLLRENDPSKIVNLSEDILQRMIAFQLAYSPDKTPDWFTDYLSSHPALIAEILVQYVSAELKAGGSFISSIYSLNHDVKYKEIAIIAAPALLKTFPVRARKDQLNILDNLLKAVLRYTPEMLPSMVRKKIAHKGMDIAQKIYWHTTNVLLNSEKAQAAFWRYMKKTEPYVNNLCQFLFDETSQDYELPVSMIGKLIELIAPYTEIDSPSGGGFVSDSKRRGYQIRNLITRLSSISTKEAVEEIDRLLALDTLENIKLLLEDGRHEQRLRKRENEFFFMKPQEIAQVLSNRAPTNATDLVSLALEVIDTIAKDLRSENDDGIRDFWNFETNFNFENEKKKKEIKKSKRDENLCRDILLRRMRTLLSAQDVDCQPEGDYHNDKRADIRLSYAAKLDLPIEIKRDDNKTLWTSLKNQLINQYAIAPRANHHGIYLVLWFGCGSLPNTIDGGKKPRSPAELQTRLEALLQPIDQKRIFIRVLDLS